MLDILVLRSTTKFPIATFIKVESSAMINEDNETIIIAVQLISEGLELFSKTISPHIMLWSIDKSIFLRSWIQYY